MKIYDVIILGAGASGLMCAANISRKKSVLLVDTNTKIARKLQISGGGKCNITNAYVDVKNFEGNPEYIAYALKKFSKNSLLQFLERSRVELELRKGRYYFCKKSANEIIELLQRATSYADFALGEEINTLEIDNEGMYELSTKQRSYRGKRVVVATGGKSFQNLGASDIGLQIAEKFGHLVKEFQPALVGLTVQKEQFWMKELSGLSCYVRIKVADRIIEEEMLFAHKGISGPAILSASLYWKKGEMSIDFFPKCNILEKIEGSKKLLSSTMELPKRLAKALLKAVDLEDKECRKVTKNDKKKLLFLQNYTFAPAGNFGFTKAEVSRGGVVCTELVKETLESKKEKGLYFIGEVVDITGELGGYNFQWAFSSAYLCAKAMK